MTPRAPRVRLATARERGFALLIVLWTVSFLALLGTQITAAGHGEAQLAANLRGAAVAEAAADGAVYETILHLLDASDRRWAADGTVRRVAVGRVAVDVTATDQGGKVDVNIAPLPLLTALLRQVGADRSSAAGIAAAIADWRSPSRGSLPNGAKTPRYRALGREWGPPNAPLRSIDELGLVLGITPELLARLTPHITLYLGAPPRRALADPVVTQALIDAQGANPRPGGADEVDPDAVALVVITAAATGPDGSRFGRTVLARVGPVDQPSDGFAPPFQILRWGSGS